MSAATKTRAPYPGARSPALKAPTVFGHPISICVEPFNWGILVEYLGAPHVLLAAGCLTDGMAIHRNRGRKNLDARGHNYAMHRSPIRAMPDRLRVRLYINRENEDAALELPGVRELFPAGVPHVEPPPAEYRETDTTPQTVSEWREQVGGFCESLLDTVMVALEGGPGNGCYPYGDRFRVAEADVQVAELLRAGLLSAINRARVVDLKREGLRLVVDNTR
jgi:hypothetical protein